MERYVIVCLMKDQVLDFHEKLVEDVCERFKVKRQKLPAHFTIKAPFETDNIKDIMLLTEDFCSQNESAPILLKDYGHFRDSVVYIDVKPSREAAVVHDKYIDSLKTLPWLEWKKNEGKGRVFHCTVVSKLPADKYLQVWPYVQNFPCEFHTSFNNISILKWDRDRWTTYKKYELK